jgi:hypothetical protein
LESYSVETGNFNVISVSHVINRSSDILRNFGKDTHSNEKSTPTMALYIRGGQLSPYSDQVRGWATEQPWFHSRHEDEIFFLYSTVSLPIIGGGQPSVPFNTYLALIS